MLSFNSYFPTTSLEKNMSDFVGNGYVHIALKGDETGVRVVTAFFPRKVPDSDLEMVNGMFMYMSIHCIVTSHHNTLKVHIALV